jgi:hypothetical protein
MSKEKNEVEVSIEDQIKAVELANKLADQKIKAAELEAKQLELEERKYHIQDLKTRIEERSIVDLQKQQNRQSQGATFAQDDATDRYKWKVCTHRKGGMVSPRDMRALTTGGNEDQYAVIKHQMINGDIWVRCLRCGKTWNPPVESNFYFKGGKVVAPADGVFDKNQFEKAFDEHQRAVAFPTRNSMSGSVQCRFTLFNTDTGRHEDASDVYRENIKDSTLR